MKIEVHEETGDYPSNKLSSICDTKKDKFVGFQYGILMYAHTQNA